MFAVDSLKALRKWQVKYYGFLSHFFAGSRDQRRAAAAAAADLVCHFFWVSEVPRSPRPPPTHAIILQTNCKPDSSLLIAVSFAINIGQSEGILSGFCVGLLDPFFWSARLKKSVAVTLAGFDFDPTPS